MLTKTDKHFAVLFFLLIVAELVCGNVERLSTWHYITKPSLLIALIFYFNNQSKTLNLKTRIFILIALGFSLLGDILLMFVDQSQNFFMFGLISFLLAHIFYCYIFLTNRNSKKNPMGLILVLLIYAIGLFYLMKDGLQDLLIPVIIYMLFILLMTVTAFLRYRTPASNSYMLVLVGAILFVVSDSILALNKFYMPFGFASFSIMLTYALAQYFIVLGLLKQP